MAVTGFERWYLAVLVLNKGFHVFTIERDEAEIAALIDAERRFWHDNVLAKIPPAPDGSESAAEVINAMYPVADRDQVALFGYEGKIREYLDLDAQVNLLEQQRDAIKQQIQLAMSDAEIGQAQGYHVEWKKPDPADAGHSPPEKRAIGNLRTIPKPAQTVRMFKIKEGFKMAGMIQNATQAKAEKFEKPQATPLARLRGLLAIGCPEKSGLKMYWDKNAGAFLSAPLLTFTATIKYLRTCDPQAVVMEALKGRQPENSQSIKHWAFSGLCPTKTRGAWCRHSRSVLQGAYPALHADRRIIGISMLM
jgi:hypothetical protein